MDQALRELVVARQLLLLKIGLHDGAVGQVNFRHDAAVGPFHNTVTAHQRVGTTEADDCSRSSFNRVFGEFHRGVALLSEGGGHDAIVALSAVVNMDFGVIGHDQEVARIGVLNLEKAVLSHEDDGGGLGVNLAACLKFGLVVLDETGAEVAFSYHSSGANSGPNASTVVSLSDGSILKVNHLIAVLQLADASTSSSDRALNFAHLVASISSDSFLFLGSISAHDSLLDRTIWQHLHNKTFLKSESETGSLVSFILIFGLLNNWFRHGFFGDFILLLESDLALFQGSVRLLGHQGGLQ